MKELLSLTEAEMKQIIQHLNDENPDFNISEDIVNVFLSMIKKKNEGEIIQLNSLKTLLSSINPSEEGDSNG